MTTSTYRHNNCLFVVINVLSSQLRVAPACVSMYSLFITAGRRILLTSTRTQKHRQRHEFMNLSTGNFSQIKVSSQSFVSRCGPLSRQRFVVRRNWILKVAERSHLLDWEYRGRACAYVIRRRRMFEGFIRFNTGFPFSRFNIVFNIH